MDRVVNSVRLRTGRAGVLTARGPGPTVAGAELVRRRSIRFGKRRRACPPRGASACRLPRAGPARSRALGAACRLAMRTKRPTITDVARQAGVSKATVSAVLNDAGP